MELVYYIRDDRVRHVLDEVVTDAEVEVQIKGGKTLKVNRNQTLARVSRGRPYGVVVSNGRDSVGFSLCDSRDTFNKKIGLELARRREREGYEEKDIPRSIQKHIEYMLERSRRVKKWA